jgi:hypothetical protein
MMHLQRTRAIAWPSLALSSLVMFPGIDQACASQGPGVMHGSAPATLQLAMAIVVYGGSGLLMAAALIGAAKLRRQAAPDQPRRQ